MCRDYIDITVVYRTFVVHVTLYTDVTTEIVYYLLCFLMCDDGRGEHEYSSLESVSEMSLATGKMTFLLCRITQVDPDLSQVQ